ncbi:olfactory receptor 2D2-like [Ambystoma mexicanum]|uniref:olfactory receptor 2D2-like n=1 Tax=Ambystoma mexicanum TaxID=8296 RepID=UPI0037E96855
MEAENRNSTTDILIVGFSDLPRLQAPLFSMFLLLYLLILSGNFLIVATVLGTSQLHTPMYFFVTMLSLIDITYTTVVLSPMLAHFFLKDVHVSLTKCLIQMHLFVAMAAAEVVLLTVMAYDRYVAICNPLHYHAIMNLAVCIQLALGSWVGGLMVALPITIAVSGFSYCGFHTINHFFCDVTAMMKITCTSTHMIEIFIYAIGASLTLASFILISISYVNIISSIVKIKAKGGSWKAFSTSASHLTVVVVYYASICATYVRPKSAMGDSKISSLTYIIISPLCNPIIYSLKNTDFKKALMKKNNKSWSIRMNNSEQLLSTKPTRCLPLPDQ